MLVSIEGNIGSGKTTLIKEIQRLCPNVQTYEEPIEQWEEWLELLYQNEKKHAGWFQMVVLLNQIKQNKDRDLTKRFVVTERSRASSTKVFLQSHIDKGNIEPNVGELINRYYEETLPLPDKYVYLKCDPSVCLERIRKRSRSEESGIPLDFLRKIEVYHEKTFRSKHANTIVIDGGNSPEANARFLKKILLM